METTTSYLVNVSCKIMYCNAQSILRERIRLQPTEFDFDTPFTVDKLIPILSEKIKDMFATDVCDVTIDDLDIRCIFKCTETSSQIYP